MINFLFPTIKNDYSPKIFESKFLLTLAVFIFLFNFLSFNYLPGFINKVEAGSINATDLIQLTNESRQSAGLVELNQSAELTAAAKSKSEDMFAKGYWAHFGPNGETPWQFIKEAGYIYVFAGENLAKGFSTSSAVHDAWLNSPTHKANIMKPEFRDIGMYVAEGNLAGEQTTLVVQMFGSKTDTSKDKVAANTTSKASSSKSISTSSKQSSTSSNSNIKDTTPPIKPTITNPINNGFTNEPIIKITGSAENGSTVKVYLNNTYNTEGITSNSIYSIQLSTELQKGDNLIEAESIDNSGNISLKSDPVKITYDTTVPVIDTSSFKVIDKKDNIYTLLFSIDEPTAIKDITATLDSTNLIVSAINSTDYKIEGVNIETLKLVKGIDIHAEDVAGNKTDILLDGVSLNSEMEKYTSNSVTGTYNGFEEILNSITNLSIRQQINIGIALFILMFLLVDFIILFRIKKLHPERGKSALHLPHLVLVIAILIFSGLGSIK
ncbi:MAG: CAP domain-containing protein [bacterium]